MSIKGPRGVELVQGEPITLAASAARTAGANGTSIFVGGERSWFMFLLNIANASATDAGDTLDVYIDFSLDDSVWINVVHFTQRAGNAAAANIYTATVYPTLASAAPVDVTNDVAAGIIRTTILGSYVRARWAIADSGNGNSSHTFSVMAYAL